MVVAGIDFSITSPAVCIYDDEKDIYYITSWTQNERLTRNKFCSGNLVVESRYIKRNADFCLILPELIELSIGASDPELCGIEQYSFGSSGKLTVLAQSAGILKYLYYKRTNKQILEVSISYGKMCTNEKEMGNVGKYTSIEYVLSKYADSDFFTKANLKITDETPLSDWCDALGICKYTYYYCKYHGGNSEGIPAKILKTFINKE